MKHFDEAKALTPSDPAARGCAEFDWAAVCHNLDGERPEPSRSELAEALTALLRTLVVGRRFRPRAVGLRLTALVWVLDPGGIPGTPSIARLARMCGVSPNHMRVLTGAMARWIGWRNRGQVHAWNWRSGQKNPAPAPPPHERKESFSHPRPRAGLKPPPHANENFPKQVSHENPPPSAPAATSVQPRAVRRPGGIGRPAGTAPRPPDHLDPHR